MLHIAYTDEIYNFSRLRRDTTILAAIIIIFGLGLFYYFNFNTTVMSIFSAVAITIIGLPWIFWDLLCELRSHGLRDERIGNDVRKRTIAQVFITYLLVRSVMYLFEYLFDVDVWVIIYMTRIYKYFLYLLLVSDVIITQGMFDKSFSFLIFGCIIPILYFY